MKIQSLKEIVEELEKASIPKPLESYRMTYTEAHRLLMCWWGNSTK